MLEIFKWPVLVGCFSRCALHCSLVDQFILVRLKPTEKALIVVLSTLPNKLSQLSVYLIRRLLILSSHAAVFARRLSWTRAGGKAKLL